MAHTHSAAGKHRRRLVLVAAISASVFAAELIGGILTHSLALLADSAHVFTDLTGMALALAAISFAERPATSRRSYGYYRLEILAAVINALLLLGIAGAILIEAARRFNQPPDVLTGPLLVFAVIGLAGNLICALLMLQASRESLNMRAAYLEVVSDGVGSAAVLIAALVLAVTGFTIVDALASAFIGILIVPRTWTLLSEAFGILMESTPKDVETDHVRRHILETSGVRGLHDLHVWTITSGMNVISAHVVVRKDADRDAVLRDLARCLSDDFDIEHSTFQIEDADHTHSGATLHA